ncbi:hypothetical protein [Rhizobium rhizogenes]|uniref:hypothetical protein n=1 Tax=Rhizobium rhizogenes TaxID=359 RepID=UPI0022C9A44E|nr:hypothetical protein [Rhizobium rhizogenes]MCZ7487169.1 hypothetical protein [Rhizobium rhizogenes]
MTINKTKEWVLDTIIQKAEFDIINSDNADMRTAPNYIRKNSFIITLQLQTYGSYQNIIEAQRKVEKAFGRYHASVLRPQCFNTGKVSRRNKKLQPMAFTAFDIEGSRENGFQINSLYPHAHGAILFHERTLENFRHNNRRFLTPEGGYKIANPTADISLIDFKPVDSLCDLDQFLGYSLKLEPHLRDNRTNYAPFNFYPASSIDFPFWSRFGDQM